MRWADRYQLSEFRSGWTTISDSRIRLPLGLMLMPIRRVGVLPASSLVAEYWNKGLFPLFSIIPSIGACEDFPTCDSFPPVSTDGCLLRSSVRGNKGFPPG